jgi:hypothetical protein
LVAGQVVVAWWGWGRSVPAAAPCLSI